MRVFLDANFLVAAGLVPDGDYRRVLNFRSDTYVTSEHVIGEVTRNLERLRHSPSEFIVYLRSFMEVKDQFELLPVGTPLEGSGDRQALAEAIGAECELFVTSDTDFSALFGTRIKGVLVEKSAIYARRVLESQSSG
jgi:predicted nucleic acid-binding protein